MNKFARKTVMHILMLLHFALMLSSFVACWYLYYRSTALMQRFRMDSWVAASLYFAMMLYLARTYNAYQVGYFRVGELVYSQGLATFISCAVVYVLVCIDTKRILNPLPLLVLVLAQVLISALWCYLANWTYFKVNKPKKTLVFYRNDYDLAKLRELQSFGKRWNVLKWVKVEEYWLRIQTLERDGSVQESDIAIRSEDLSSDFSTVLHEMEGFEAVLVSGVEATKRNGIVKACIDTNRECIFVPHTGDVIVQGARHLQAFSVPMVMTRRAKLSPLYMFFKRAFDIFASSLGIILLSPFMAVTAIMIKSYDHGPALYKQVRLTKDGRKFKILKFRSMRQDAERDGVARLAAEHDDRITPVGRIIRKIRFDELPQLFNIFMGDMTIVGPRPERPEIAEQYNKILPAFSLRLQVKAGLTGYAQVYGKYNTQPSDKLKMDLMYINNMSVSTDFMIMLATVRILFMKESTEGVEEGQVTAASDEGHVA